MDTTDKMIARCNTLPGDAAQIIAEMTGCFKLRNGILVLCPHNA